MVRRPHHEVVDATVFNTPDLILSLSKDGQRALIRRQDGFPPARE
jgi:hypothetical protein